MNPTKNGFSVYLFDVSAKCCFRGGIIQTVQGRNLGVVQNSRMVVTVKIRRLDKGRKQHSKRASDDDDHYDEILYYPEVVSYH